MLSSSVTMMACSDSQVNSEKETTAAPQNTPAAEETAAEELENLTDYERRQLISDDLPATDFDGASFRVLTNGTFAGFDYTTEIRVEELNGDACNDVIYNRNVSVEDRFGVTIEYATSDNPHSDINTFVTAGTDDYHVVGFFDYFAYNPINSEVLLNWCETPYVNLEKPWHNKAANDGATINNRLYAICSDLSITSMTYTHAIFANLELAADYGYSAQSLYDLVNEGQWTLDKFSEMVSGMYIDSNGDGKANSDDKYGFGYEITNPADVWLTAMGEKVLTVTEEGGIELTFMTEKLVNAYDKLYALHYDNKGFTKLGTQYDEEKYFATNKLVFAPMRLAAAFNQLRDMDSPYTMLPYPKYDENQEAYYTNADDKFTVFGLPLTSYANIEFVGIIYEALSAGSYKTVYPIYYDTALKGKYSTDAQTAEMVELIMAGRSFDFSFQFGQSHFQNLCYFIRDKIKNQKKNIASEYKKLEKKLKKDIEDKFAPLYDVEIDL